MQIKTISVPLQNSNEVPEYLRLILEYCEYKEDLIIRYTFLLEEVLLCWKEHFPGDSEILITRKVRGQNAIMECSVAGEKVEPFVPAEEALYPEDPMAFPIQRMHDRLISGIGSEFKTTYRKGRNVVRGVFPKKNAESRLFNRNLILLMIPIVLQTLLNSIANYADGFMLSFTSADAMAAVSLVTQFISIFDLLGIAVTRSATALISQFWGERERNSINATAAIAIRALLIFAAFFAIISLLFPLQILAFFTDVASVQQQGIIYLRILAPTFFFSAVFCIYFCCFRIMGKVAAALKIGIAGCIFNVVLNALLIFGLFDLPACGIIGAAIATFVSHLFQCLACFVYNKKEKVFSINFKKDRLQKAKVHSKFLSQFGPNVSQSMIWKAACMIIVSAYGHLGEDILAAFSVLTLLNAVISSVKSGIGSAAAVFVGSALGRNKPDEALWKSRRTLRLGTCLCLFSMVIYIICGFALRWLPMNLSEGAKEVLFYMVLINGVSLFFAGMNGMINDGALRVGGDVKAILVIDTICMWGIMVPFALLGTYVFKWPALLMAILLKSDEIISFPFKWARYKQYRWLRKL